MTEKTVVERAREDFVLFIFILWEALGLRQPTRCQIDIARKLASGDERFFILQAFRGVGKSFITCAFVVWLLWRDPQKKILIVSASKERADANSIFIKRIINLLPFLHHLKPTPNQRDSVILFDVGPATDDISPSVKSVGIYGQMTGSRADIIIADDVETPNNSATQMQREKLLEAVQEFGAILKPDGFIIYLGTPQTEMTLYRSLEEFNFKTTVWPARVPRDEASMLAYGNRLAPMIKRLMDEGEATYWTPLEPERFPEDVITEKEGGYGRSGFALQFMLNPSLSDENRYPLKLRDLIVCHLDNNKAPLTFQWLPNPQNRVETNSVLGLKGDTFHRYHDASQASGDYVQKILVIDPSGRGKDETAYAVLFALNGYIFVMETGGTRGGYEETTLLRLANIAKKWEVNEVVLESNFGDGMFTSLFKPVLHTRRKCDVVEFRSKGQKEVRIIDCLEPVISGHRLVVNEEIIEKDFRTAVDHEGKQDQRYALFYQMTRLTKDRGSLLHDDRIDALAIGVEHLKSVMEINSKKGEKEFEIEWLQEQMENMGTTTHTVVSHGIEISWHDDHNDRDYGNFLNL